MLFTATAGFKHAAINDLDLLHRMQLLSDVLEELARKEGQLTRMLSIHRQGGAEDMEPHAVDDLGHVARPICLIHGFNFLLR